MATLKQISDLVNGTLHGEETLEVSGIAGLKEAREGSLTFLFLEKYIPLVKETHASAILLQEGLNIDSDLPCIRVKDANHALAQVSELFDRPPTPPAVGIHPTAVVAPSAKIGENVSIGPLSVVERDAEIGDNSIIFSQGYVGEGVKIGKNCFLHPRVTILHRSEIGSNVILQSGVVIGSDGFGYATVAGKHTKIKQIGIVSIEDDVEIGSNTTIDRARMDRTVIKKGTKIDNQVQIAHNVQVGEDCLIAAQTGIAGSSSLENHVVLAGQVGVAGHIVIGAGCILTAKSGIAKNLTSGGVYSGRHAIPHANHMRELATQRKLPEMARELKNLRKTVDEWTSKNEKESKND